MPEYVADTVVLQVMAFSHPRGIDILLDGLAATRVRFPAEVYNHDEGVLPLNANDEGLSELARGLRYAKRQVLSLPPIEGERYATWLRHAIQLAAHLETERLLPDPLDLDELPRREAIMEEYGIGRGEAACLTLLERYRVQGVFLSSDEEACKIARNLGLPTITIPQILESWIYRVQPGRQSLDELIEGMRAAKFGVKGDLASRLRELTERYRC